MEYSTIDTGRYHFIEGNRLQRGFTLIEMLVVIMIIAVLSSIIVPVVSKVKRQAIAILSGNNQRQIVGGVTMFAMDHNEMYPETVARSGLDNSWNWVDPRKIIGEHASTPGPHRAVSEYLGDYIDDASLMFCPNAPRKFKYLQEFWDAGDQWNNPDLDRPFEPLTGNYCFYWNYNGFLEDRNYPFRGPVDSTGRPGRSKMVVSDYFGYDFRKSRDLYGSCERFKGSSERSETGGMLSEYWAGAGDKSLNGIEIKLRAAFTDGHVETYSAKDVIKMETSGIPDGTEPDIGIYGDFYLPRNCLR